MKYVALPVFAFVLLLSGCATGLSPITAGEVRAAGTDKAIALDSEQLKALQTWLQQSQSGWGRCLYTPPGSSVSVFLQHADGSKSSVSLLKFPSSQAQTTLRASNLSGSNLADQPCAVQTFPLSEIVRFTSIIGATP
ncbi:MAG: hypothetical protein QM776_15535 [Rhodocyclaceae bacterium]